MHTYTAYGLGIHSTLPLPELQTLAEVGADVVIEIENLNWSPPETICSGSYFQMTAKEAYLFWERVGAFLVRDGKEIIVDPLPGVEERIIRLPLLGAVLAVLLHQRGFLVLHASAVAINGGVVAFLGEKGQGKSTMAASLYARGHTMMADDVVALDFGGTESPIVLPGFPQFKLWPEAAASSLGDDPETLPQLHPQVEKRARRVADRFSQRPLPLRRIYVLSEGPAPQIKPLQPQIAIVQLIANSYSARFGKQLLQGVEAYSHFHQCMSLAKNLPVCCLDRPRSLSLLPNVAELVEEDLAGDIIISFHA